ncbi:hypothetical protein [uncultured Formosa sp.]|uniref:hypothetical protein n=1 Tax=uncultured Formosa sp. TaxID=255435 RepID=UPI002624C078|nr:hypothetical protein [uncultured Formosa sp.]
MKRILIIGFLFLSLTSCNQLKVNIPEEFVETKIPTLFSEEWAMLIHDRNEFGVEIIDNKLNIEKITERKQAELKIEGGKLKGISEGEWSGKLLFVPNSTAKKEVEIKSGNIKFIFQFQGKTYFIESLEHLTYTGGAIYELKQDGEHFTYEKRLEFKDAPEAFTIHGDSFLIATHQNFYVIKDFKTKIIFRDTFWSSLFPHSIAVFDYKNVYMGIRSGFVKLDLINKKMKFYKYTE